MNPKDKPINVCANRNVTRSVNAEDRPNQNVKHNNPHKQVIVRMMFVENLRRGWTSLRLKAVPGLRCTLRMRPMSL